MSMNVLTLRQTISSHWVAAAQVVTGSIFLAIVSQLAVPLPFTPVPMSLQTLGVMLLAMTLGPRKAALAVAGYLTQATMGLPVLAGGIANPFWFLLPRAGYLLSFVAAAYITGTLLEKVKDRGLLKSWLILSLNEATILVGGSLWLGLFVGFDSSLALGVVPFIPGAIAKITLATTAEKPLNRFRS